MNESDLQAEKIEIIPELPTFNDSEDDDFSEYDDENEAASEHRTPFDLSVMDDGDDDDGEPFDEYGKYTLRIAINNVLIDAIFLICSLSSDVKS